MRAVSAANTLSPAFGGPDQRLGRMGSRWSLSVSIPALAWAGCGREVVADLVRGETEMIIARIPEPGVPVEDYGAPVVNSSSAAGLILPVRGLLASKLVRKGKFLTIITGGQRFVHIVTADATMNGSGVGSLSIWPMLRRQPSNGAVIELAEPKIEGFIEPGQEFAPKTIGAVSMQFTIKERE